MRLKEGPLGPQCHAADNFKNCNSYTRIRLSSGADTGFMKGGGTVYETLPEAVHRGA